MAHSTRKVWANTPKYIYFVGNQLKYRYCLVHFLHFLTLFSHIIFGLFFAIFDPPMCPLLGLGSPYGPHTWSIRLDCGIGQKTDPGNWFCSFFYSFMFMVIFSRFGLLEGLWGHWLFHGGPPRAPMNSFTSIVTLNPCQVQPPVQSGKFTDFWGMLCC